MKKKKNNRLFVFFSIIYYIIFLLSLDIGVFTWFAIDSRCEDIGLTIFFTASFLILPLGLLVWCIIFFLLRLELSQEGITKTWFGFVVKKYKWEELKYMYFKGDFRQWLFLSERDLSSRSLTRNRLAKGVIYFFVTEKKLHILKQYIPDDLKIKLDELKDK